MTTTDLIKLLQEHELGGISKRPREISLTVNGKYMPNPEITLSSTGDGICGPEISLDIDGEMWEIEEQQSSDDCEYNRGYRDGYDKGNLNGYELRKSEEKKSEDCVSRRRVIDAINDLTYIVQNLPSVTPTHKIGKWKSDGHGHIICTACNEVNVSTWKSKHCPCCGAEMVGDEDGRT